jgi:glycosyltransferase involved in cell wall biosynthesis
VSARQVIHILESGERRQTALARIVAALARWTDRERYRHEAWFLGGGGPLLQELREKGLEVREVRWRGFRRDPVGAVRFWRALAQTEFAILHQHLGGRSIRWLAARATDAPIVLHLHSRFAGPPEKAAPLDVRNADAVIAVSQAVASQVPGASPHVVYPGLDVADYETLQEEGAANRSAATVIGTAARLVPEKGCHYLLEAVAKLRREWPDLRLEIAGTGPQEEDLKQQARSLGLGDSAGFLGWQHDMAPVLRRWDVFALPTLEESFFLAALEAMAAGLPVVATNVGGIPEFVEDGKTGWLVPPRDSDAVAARLRRLLQNPTERRTFGEAGRRRVRDHFSARQMAASITRIYDDLLQRPQEPG